MLAPSGRPRGLSVEQRLRRLLTDPPPSARLWARGRASAGTCIFPAHHHTVVAMQIDHSSAFGHAGKDGRIGRTRADNLGGICDRGDDAKTHGHWQLEQPSPGTFSWTSRTGRTYRRRARPLLPRPTSSALSRHRCLLHGIGVPSD